MPPPSGGGGESVTWQRSYRSLPLAAALGGWTLVHLVYFGEPRFHLPVTPVMAVLAAPLWLWAAGLLQRPILSKWHALRSPTTPEVDRAEAL